jgi:nucleotide-binding universal stress UspA family protein
MSETLLFVRQHSEAALLAAAAGLVAPTGDVEVLHLEPGEGGDGRSQVVIDATLHALSQRGVNARGSSTPIGRASVAGRMQELIEERKPDLLVLGARRLGRVGALVQGSVTQQVLNRCGTLALVVPEDATVDEPPLRQVVVAVEGNDDIDRLGTAASHLPADAEYLLVHVARRVAVHTVGPHGVYVEIGETSDPELDAVAHALERAGRGRVRRSLLPAGRPAAAAIAAAAKAAGAQVVVVGSNRPGRLRTLTETSTSREMLTQVALPVLFAPVP